MQGTCNGAPVHRCRRSHWGNAISPARLSSGFILLRRFQLARADAMTTEPWVSVEQVAQHLGVAKDTVYRRQG